MITATSLLTVAAVNRTCKYTDDEETWRADCGGNGGGLSAQNKRRNSNTNIVRDFESIEGKK